MTELVTNTDAREALAERLIEDATRALETLSVYLGTALGLYRTLAGLGEATFEEVAERAGVAPRYAREWLEQQATSGYVECADPAAPAGERRYGLSRAHAEVLLDNDSPYFAGAVASAVAGVGPVVPDLLDAYRTGGGVPYSAYGRALRQGIGDLNRPMFRHDLAGWLAAVPRIDRRLREPGARVLDVGCGRGQSSIAIARAYSAAVVRGVDLDEASVGEARSEAAAEGLDDRITFAAGDAALDASAGSYDLVTVFEALHDMGDPVGVLRTARASLNEDGAVLVGDEKVADDLVVNAGLLERFQFGWSVVHCLPATLAERPVEANGTMLRAPTLERWAREAGFAEFEVAPIENDFWRFYVLRG
ncbi:SAM-dependent methyltransferase [Amycolatopsis alkalitolerans]|uniref:Class I SAM-dependent methyltransferase n=1 Tax=Amycolatopsis alkalitolerans TaxID=2547244 RepID=A0A5C4M190_9PSEU|nr:class I SAM-dependent methyltransferase [Amycolatopsis alkalitolerans]TNC23508.1 class I SAM-dependent methyltransferase [Amycolatopsis alkalitolerans]